MSIHPFNSNKFDYGEYRDDPDEFRYDDDEDSNDEFNDRNDYPDEDEDEEDDYYGGYGHDDDDDLDAGVRGNECFYTELFTTYNESLHIQINLEITTFISTVAGIIFD